MVRDSQVLALFMMGSSIAVNATMALANEISTLLQPPFNEILKITASIAMYLLGIRIMIEPLRIVKTERKGKGRR